MASFLIFLMSLFSLALRYLVSTVRVHVLFHCWSRRDFGFGRGRVHVHRLGRKFPSQGFSLGNVAVCWNLGRLHMGWVLPVAPGVGCSPGLGSAWRVFLPVLLVAGRWLRRQLVCCSSMARFACRHCCAFREESLWPWPLPKIFFGLFVVVLFCVF